MTSRGYPDYRHRGHRGHRSATARSNRRANNKRKTGHAQQLALDAFMRALKARQCDTLEELIAMARTLNEECEPPLEETELIKQRRRLGTTGKRVAIASGSTAPMPGLKK